MNFLLTRQAEQDLSDIWRYTYDKWGERQADDYLHKLESCFNKIATGQLQLRDLLDHSTKIKFIRCEHHYIFLIIKHKPIIIAVLHEKMDLLQRIKKRLTNKNPDAI